MASKAKTGIEQSRDGQPNVPVVVEEDIQGRLVKMISFPQDGTDYRLKMGYRKLSTVLKWAERAQELLPQIKPDDTAELGKLKKDDLLEVARIEKTKNEALMAELAAIKAKLNM